MSFIIPNAETAPPDAPHLPVAIHDVKTFRKLHVINTDAPGIQFVFIGGGATIEWSFLTEADRDTAYTHIETEYVTEIG